MRRSKRHECLRVLGQSKWHGPLRLAYFVGDVLPQVDSSVFLYQTFSSLRGTVPKRTNQRVCFVKVLAERIMVVRLVILYLVQTRVSMSNIIFLLHVSLYFIVCTSRV